MKKNISWQVLIVIGLVGDLIGRFTVGIIGDAIGVLGDICLLIGIANMIIAWLKNKKIRKEMKNISQEALLDKTQNDSISTGGFTKKILFPFFEKEKHGFLAKKWFFRAIVVIYVSAFIISIPYLWGSEVSSVYEDCEKEARVYWGNGTIPNPESSDAFNGYYNSLQNCNKLAREWWTMAMPYSIIIPVIIFYLLQLFFFKVVVNYIVLGSKK